MRLCQNKNFVIKDIMSHSNLFIFHAIFLFTISVAMAMQIDHSVIEQKSNIVFYTALYNQISINLKPSQSLTGLFIVKGYVFKMSSMSDY